MVSFAFWRRRQRQNQLIFEGPEEMAVYDRSASLWRLRGPSVQSFMRAQLQHRPDLPGSWLRRAHSLHGFLHFSRHKSWRRALLVVRQSADQAISAACSGFIWREVPMRIVLTEIVVAS